MIQPIDMSFLIDALEDHTSMASCYLDKQTGEILRISEYDTEEEKNRFTIKSTRFLIDTCA